ncbi:acyl-CoA dehydrogenase family protein [Actinomadura sp. 9N407]|uniref:acyl-CoA dehydrogenase family protein n=1 Tax=Actinomadura sp. 9N407 TaxID=3375154 RepID=UPI00379E7F47
MTGSLDIGHTGAGHSDVNHTDTGHTGTGHTAAGLTGLGHMSIDLSKEAAEYGRQALRAFEAAGGDGLVQAAEREPERREALVAPVLAELGAWHLDPRGDAEELEAAAALCRSAGYWALPYPLAERLARPADLDADGLLVVADSYPAGAVAGLGLRWAAVTLDGRRGTAVARPPDATPRTSAFVTGLDVRPLDDQGARDVALGLVLPCWTLLGMLDRAIDLTREHVLVREQFGQALARFQGVRFQLTDAEVERSGAEVLARYALWSVQADREEALDEALDDALALRLAAVEAADVVFRVAHQLHGATGFCDETSLSWISRYSQPLRRLPLGLSATRDQLTRRIGRRGLTGLFGGSPERVAP